MTEITPLTGKPRQSIAPDTTAPGAPTTAWSPDPASKNDQKP